MFFGVISDRRNVESSLDFGPRLFRTEMEYITIPELLIFILFAFPLIIALWRFFRSYHWQAPKVYLERPFLQLGQRNTIRYEHDLKDAGKSLSSPVLLSAYLICQEVTVIDHGTTTDHNCVNLHTIALDPLHIPASSSSSGVRGNWDIELPLSLSLSIMYSDIWVAWKLKVIEEKQAGRSSREVLDFVIEVR